MERGGRPGCGQSWVTFLKNHTHEIAACDLFTVPTISFRVLHVFVAMSHDRRRILGFGVTTRPTSIWVAKQISTALSGCRGIRLLVRDNDRLYARAFLEALRDQGVRSVPITLGSPWMNGHVERLIGTIRRECTDHLLVFNEGHLRRVLAEYVEYYNASRPHCSLDGNSPKPRWCPRVRDGPVVSRPVLGGLHHVYGRAG
jgi:transposase InsO family protein